MIKDLNMLSVLLLQKASDLIGNVVNGIPNSIASVSMFLCMLRYLQRINTAQQYTTGSLELHNNPLPFDNDYLRLSLTDIR